MVSLDADSFLIILAETNASVLQKQILSFDSHFADFLITPQEGSSNPYNTVIRWRWEQE